MKDERKTKQQLIEELNQSREHIVELESSRDELRQAEQALRESEERYRVLVDSSLAGVSVRGKENILFVNQRLADQSGYSREELLGKSFLDFVHPEDREAVRERGARRISGESFSKSLPFRIMTKDGEIRWLETYGEIIDYYGEKAVLDTVLDITEQKKAEEGLENRLQFETLLSEISTTFINIPANEIDQAIKYALARIVDCLGIDRSTLCQISEEEPHMRVTHSWAAEGVEPAPSSIRGADFPWILAKLIQGQTLSISRISDIPAEAEQDRLTLKRLEQKSFVAAPLFVGGEIIGVIFFGTVRNEKDWSKESIRWLRMVSEVLANALARKKTEEALQERLRFEQLFSELSAGFVNLPETEIDNEIDHAIHVIAEFLVADSAQLLEFSEDDSRLSTTHMWSSSDMPLSTFLQADKELPWAYKQVLNGETVILSHLPDDLPEEAVQERKLALKDGTRSVISIPLRVGESILGAFALISRRYRKNWSQELVKRFQLVGEILANALARKRTEQALRAERGRLGRLMDGMADAGIGIDIVGIDHTIHYQNSTLSERFGDSLERKCYEAYMELEKPCDFCPMIEAIREKQTARRELTGADGRDYELLAAPFPDPDGTADKAIEIIQDITERKQTEHALQESEEAYRRVVDSSRTGIYIRRGDRFVFVNRRMTEILGYSEKELLELSIASLVHPEDRERAKLEMSLYDSGEATRRLFQCRILAKNGDTRWIELFGVSFMYKGEFAVLNNALDITDRKLAEQALEESEQRYRSLVDRSPTGICVLQDEKLLFANNRLEEILGYPNEELLGKHFLDFAHPDDRQLLAEHASIVMSGSFPENVPYRFLTRDGRIIWLNIGGGLIDFHGSPALLANILDITDRKKAEEQIKESEERYRTLYETANDAIFVMKDEAIIDCNKKTLELFGASEKQIIGKTPFDFSPQVQPCGTESREKGAGILKEAFAGKPQFFEWSHAKLDRSLVQTDVSLNRFSLGNDVHLFATVRDITERKRSEEELQLFRDLIDRSNDGIFVVVPDSGRLLDVNEKACNDLGYTREELLEMKVIDLEATLPDASAWEEHVSKVREKRSVILEGEHKRKNGATFPAEISIKIITRGENEYLVAVTRDLTERKRAEEELQKTQALLLAAIEQTPAGIIVADAPEGNIRTANSAALGIRGKTNEPLTNIPLELHPKHWEIYQPDGTPFNPEDLPLSQSILYGRTSENVEMIIRRPNGEDRWILVNAAPIRDAKGAIIAGIAVFPDITEQKLAGEDKKNLEAQLLQAQKMEAIGTLAGGVAHDFNNLLTVILEHAQLAMHKVPKDNPAHRDLHEVVNASNSAADLTRQLLAFSRKQVIELKVINLNDTLTGMNRMLRRLIREDIELRIQTHADLWATMADPGQVEQILINLIVNARDAMPTGGNIIIETVNAELDEELVKERPDVEAGQYVRFSVSDTGYGMDKETLGHIFEPFYTTKAEGEGTGLGLATVYGIVKQHDGDIQVYSEEGRGTTFSVYLPARGTGTELEKSQPEKMEPIPRGSETVFVVEDEKSLREMAVEILSDLGYNILEASNGREALDMIEKANIRPDLLVTDVVMPKMSGDILAEKMAELFPEIKILLISGYPDGLIQHSGSLKPGTELLQKPFTPERIARKVREILDK